jgi:hypothetical protein
LDLNGDRTAFLRKITGGQRLSTEPGVVPAYFVTTYHATLGKKDEAFDRLNEALEERFSDIEILEVDARVASAVSSSRSKLHFFGLCMAALKRPSPGSSLRRFILQR